MQSYYGYNIWLKSPYSHIAVIYRLQYGDYSHMLHADYSHNMTAIWLILLYDCNMAHIINDCSHIMHSQILYSYGV